MGPRCNTVEIGANKSLLVVYGGQKPATLARRLKDATRSCVLPTDDQGRVCDRLAGLGQVIDPETIRQVLEETGRVNPRVSRVGIAHQNGADTATGETVQYNWDHRNRLTKVTFKDGTGTVTKVVEFDYDVFNRRIAKRVDDDGDGTVDRSYRFVYDSSGKLDPATGVPLDDVVLVFEDPDGSGSQPFALSSRLLHGPAIDQIVASESATGEILWALADHQGTVRDWVEYDPATDTTTVVHHLKYDSFGRITAIEDGSGNPAALSPPLSAILTPAASGTPTPSCTTTAPAGTTRPRAASSAKTRWASPRGMRTSLAM